jgi:cytidylate kinase
LKEERRLLITIDGPAGAGKTTVSKLLAEKLNYRYLDTGALYRAVAWVVRKAGLQHDDDEEMGRICHSLKLDLKKDRLIANGEDITDFIRTPEITMLASAVSARQVVRKALLSLQREIGGEPGLVAEGRDMGTVVFPGADRKFFLNASVRQRAQRRLVQYGQESSQTLEQIEADIRQRDENDSSRDLAPLKPADDAILIDSTTISAEEVVEKMLSSLIVGEC